MLGKNILMLRQGLLSSDYRIPAIGLSPKLFTSFFRDEDEYSLLWRSREAQRGSQKPDGDDTLSSLRGGGRRVSSRIASAIHEFEASLAYLRTCLKLHTHTYTQAHAHTHKKVLGALTLSKLECLFILGLSRVHHVWWQRKCSNSYCWLVLWSTTVENPCRFL